MKIEYSYAHFWEESNWDSWNGTGLQIQHIRVKYGPVLLCSICEAEHSKDIHSEKIVSYITDQIAKWFYDKAMEPLASQPLNHHFAYQLSQSYQRLLYSLTEEVERYQAQYGCKQTLAITTIIISKQTYLMMQRGHQSLHHLSKSEIKTIPRKIPIKQKRLSKQNDWWCIGQLKKGCGILISSEKYLDKVGMDLFQRQYQVGYGKPDKIKKFMMEIGKRIHARKKHEEMVAILVWRN